MRTITSHVIKLGHGHIGFISDHELEKHKPRLGADRRTLYEHHLSDDATEDDAADNIISEGHRLALKLLHRQPELTAIVCNGDPLAIGAIHACQEMRLRVPEDISVTGLDDIDLAILAHPFLTTICVPRRRRCSSPISSTDFGKPIFFTPTTSQPTPPPD